jgi:DNA-binding Lrp family transcriptional regulator
MGAARTDRRSAEPGPGAPAAPEPAGAVSLDQQIAAALQLNGRATWREIAGLLGTSESTVARHARALLEAGVIRTTVAADPLRCGTGYPVLLKFACAPGHAGEVAGALTARPDVRFLALVTGPFDVVAEVIVPSRDVLAHIVIDEMTALPGLLRTTSETILRTFKMAYDWSRPLLESVVPVPRPASIDVRAPVPAVTLDEVDDGLIDALRGDARRSHQELAELEGISESAARRRVDHLIGTGAVTPVVLVDPEFLGYGVEVLFDLRVDLARLEDVASALVERPEVRYLSAASGDSDLVGEVILRTHDDLYRFRTRVLGALEGIRDVHTALEVQPLRRAYLPMRE